RKLRKKFQLGLDGRLSLRKVLQFSLHSLAKTERFSHNRDDVLETRGRIEGAERKCQGGNETVATEGRWGRGLHGVEPIAYRSNIRERRGRQRPRAPGRHAAHP